ncbi:hypothetical protein Pmani_004332 [Petrolisthes manimaculis]|uniref:Uncharacterized protein n=1 Tax=Petrolisthes manimaculis TaxID=1843537 RepID=A0AAE1QEW1_9EUCA|nr:hypothetical protein Pmani_004332 [Petrolisthes manimaculis]
MLTENDTTTTTTKTVEGSSCLPACHAIQQDHTVFRVPLRPPVSRPRPCYPSRHPVCPYPKTCRAHS